MWGSHWTMALERRGIPGVFIVDEPFRADVDVTCRKEGMSRLRRVEVPHPCGDVPDADIPALARRLASELTRPLAPEERHPPARTDGLPARIAFRGTLDEIHTFFDRRGWTDGLPIVPPTERAVARMLKGTRHPADEVVSERMLPEGWRVDVEKVAAVGVMAGCDPAHLPLLLAMVEALEADWFASALRSTTSFSMASIVNGPYARRIGMNGGLNALGSGTGNRVNAVVGRFLRLALICLGGAHTGVSDMSSIGNPSKYSFAFCENEAESPWEPFHASLGRRAGESTVTLLRGGWGFLSPFARMMGDVESALDSMSQAIAQFELPTGALLVMDPSSAARLQAAGYGKAAVEERVRRKAVRRAADFRSDYFYTPFIEPVLRGKTPMPAGKPWPASHLDAADEALIEVFPEGSVRVVVVGGASNAMTQAWHLSRPSTVSIDRWT